MQVANIAIWDIETGGFDKTKQGLCEIALIVIDSATLEELGRYETIIAPYQLPDGNMTEYKSEALSYNGLTLSQINNGKEAKTAAKEIVEFLKPFKKGLRGGNGKIISAGHNIEKFDIPFFEYFLSIFNIKYSDLFQKWCYDTLWMTRLRWSVDGSILNHKLGTACEKAGIKLIDAHKAMNDVEGNTKLLKYFLSSMRENNGAVSNEVEQRPRVDFRF